MVSDTGRTRQQLTHAIPAEPSHLMESPPRSIMSQFVGVPVLFQAFNKVRLRYYRRRALMTAAATSSSPAIVSKRPWRGEMNGGNV